MDRPAEGTCDTELVEFDSDGPVVKAGLIGKLLNIQEDLVSGHIQNGGITTLCEKGIGEHDGGFRLSFFHRNRRAQIEVDRHGQVSNRTVIDFGDRPLPASLRRPSSNPAS
ncbi:MAG: DUF6522 family protein [Anderseniella sp.]